MFLYTDRYTFREGFNQNPDDIERIFMIDELLKELIPQTITTFVQNWQEDRSRICWVTFQ